MELHYHQLDEVLLLPREEAPQLLLVEVDLSHRLEEALQLLLVVADLSLPLEEVLQLLLVVADL